MEIVAEHWWLVDRESVNTKLMVGLAPHRQTTYYMDYLTHIAPMHYLCNRPPGAAGAMIVTPSHILFAGVFPLEHQLSCRSEGCMMEDGHCVRNMHAEQRIIALAAAYGIPTMGATIYSVLKPCYPCTRAIIAAGIFRIYYAGIAYDEEKTRNILEISGVTCEKIDVGLEYGQGEIK